jgi:hypothetical protein
MLIFQRIKQHLVNHSILVPEQYGFQDGVSTDTATYKLMETIFNTWNMKEYMAQIFFYLTTECDRVNHELLLSQMKFFGVRSVILEWLKSYLNNRKQRVDSKFTKTHSYSGWEIVEHGILQGSVLSPLLFNTYINDFQKIINKLSHTILFADNTITLVTSTNYIDLKQKLNSILHHISK